MKVPWGKRHQEVSIGGPVERDGDELVLLIPLAAGGNILAKQAKGIGELKGDDLRIVIPAWLAEKLDIVEGSQVIVDNLDGKFRITRND